MTSDRPVIDELRDMLQPVLDEQAAKARHPMCGRCETGHCAIHPQYEVLWHTEPCNFEAVTVRLGGPKGVIEVMPPEELVNQITQNIELVTLEATDPLRYLYQPPEYRLIDLEMVRKRLRNPGVQLILWVNGGIRSAKTEFCSQRIAANFWYTKNAWCWATHETDTTSRTIQQPRIRKFVPIEMNPESGKFKDDENTSFKYKKGTGFTNSQFHIYWKVRNEKGQEEQCGGRFEFRFFLQGEGTKVGQELSSATQDEKVPPDMIKLVDDRLLTRAGDTRSKAFMERMMEAERILMRGEDLPLPLLGAVYHGVQTISYTPKFGWSASCARFLLNARKYGFYDPRPMLKVAMQEAIDAMPTEELRREKAEELEREPWTLGNITEVPRFAQPTEKRLLVAYMPTYANQFKGNWSGAVQQVQGDTDEQKRITLFGDVDKNWTTQFGYDPNKHIFNLKVAPRLGTIYEICDPAPAKPWVIKWYLVDALERKYIVQEWPCPTWPIESDKFNGLPGFWALPSQTDKRNGDKGPAYHLRLGYDYARYTRLIWEGRKRLYDRFAKSGAKFEGKVQEGELRWKDRPSWNLQGPFVIPEESRLDRRFAQAPTVHNGHATTILDVLLEEENAPDWMQTTSPSIEAGNTFIEIELAKDVMGMPAFMVEEECENSQFTLATYTVPEDKIDTRDSDEACKDFRDPDAYFLTGECSYVAPRGDVQRGRGFS